MESVNNFRREMQLESPDFEAVGLTSLFEHPDLIIIESNGFGGALNGAPIAFTVERHLAGKDPSAPTVSLTMDELIELRNHLNEAIVYAERLG